MSKFKKGQRVVVKDWEEMVKEYGMSNSNCINVEFGFIQQMKCFCGAFAKVKGIEDKTKVILEFENEMLRAVQKEDDWTFGNQVVRLVEESDFPHPKDKVIVLIYKYDGKVWGVFNSYLELREYLREKGWSIENFFTNECYVNCGII